MLTRYFIILTLITLVFCKTKVDEKKSRETILLPRLTKILEELTQSSSLNSNAECQCENGQCEVDPSDGKLKCRCFPEYGLYSPTRCKACYCGKGANCTFDVGFFSTKVQCICPEWSKKGKDNRCEDPCSPDPCQSGGICNVDYNGLKCDCPPSHAGKFCEIERTTLTPTTDNGLNFTTDFKQSTYDPDNFTFHFNQTTLDPNLITSDSNQTTFNPFNRTFEFNQTTSNPNKFTLDLNHTTFDPRDFTFDFNQTTADPNNSTFDFNQTTFTPYNFTFDFNQTTVYPNNFTLDFNKTTYVPYNFTFDFNQTTVYPNNFTLDFNETTYVPYNFTFDFNQTTVYPNNFTLDFNETTYVPYNFTFEVNQTTVYPNNFTLDFNKTTYVPYNFTFEVNQTTISPYNITLDFNRTTFNPYNFTVDLNVTTIGPFNYTFVTSSSSTSTRSTKISTPYISTTTKISVCADDSECYNGGLCRLNKNGIGFCKCLVDYIGDRCEFFEACAHLEKSCNQFGSICRVVDGKPRCECPSGKAYNGHTGNCEDVCTRTTCFHGNCEIHGNIFKCRCDEGYSGKYCEEPITPHKNIQRETIAFFVLSSLVIIFSVTSVCFMLFYRSRPKIDYQDQGFH